MDHVNRKGYYNFEGKPDNHEKVFDFSALPDVLFGARHHTDGFQ